MISAVSFVQEIKYLTKKFFNTSLTMLLLF